MATLTMWGLRERWTDMAAAVRRASDRVRPDLVHVSLGELAPALAGVRERSTLLLFDKGQPVKQIVGAKPKLALESDLSDYL